MRRTIPIFLWTIVLLVSGYLVWQWVNTQADDPDDGASGDGRAFATTSWNQLPLVKPFELIDQTDTPFDSRRLAGKPYAISFFFTECPTICAQLNRKIQLLTDNFENQDLMFLSVTCRPQTDTPEVLARYAKNFEADPEQWKFLTEQMYKIQEAGRNFEVILDPNTHTDDIMLVDKWGKFRDRFRWNDPREIARFESVANALLAETEPPLGVSFETRNVLAGVPHNERRKAWLDEFFLTDHNGDEFFSRDLTGKVWIGSQFFTSCPSICRQQNEYLVSFRDRIKDKDISFASITTDPTVDTPAVLRKYRESLGIDTEDWKFLTGDKTYVRRVSEEFFKAALMDSGHHSTMLFVVDRWGNVRGSFDWQKDGAESAMLALIDELQLEKTPNDRFAYATSDSKH